MIVGRPRHEGDRLSADVEDRSGRSHELSFTVPGDVDGRDAVVPVALLSAMWRHEPLELTEPVSSRLLDQLPAIQEIFLTWDKALRPAAPAYAAIEVRAPRRARPQFGADRGVAAFFTAGVDSFYSAVRHRDELDALVFVHGFDTTVHPGPLRDRIAAGVRSAAAELELPLVEVHTDVRALSDEYGVHWLDAHGAALASVALLLGPRFRKMYVSATTTYAALSPLGSHPLLDPLWSTEDVEIVHDGGHANRVEKLEELAKVPAARRWLRVCWENRGGAYNCGRCEKCLRTMVGLRLAGLVDEFETLPPPRLRDVARVAVPGTGTTWRSYREHLEATGGDPRLLWALRAAFVRRALRHRASP